MNPALEKYICALMLVLSITLGQALAIEPFYVLKDFGNVKLRIETVPYDEGINKIILWGQLAENLCKALDYSEPVFLDFVHYTPDFAISYEKVDNEYLWGTNTSNFFLVDNKVVSKEVGNFLEGNAIIIKQITYSRFQPQTTLKLLEYAILNLHHIKSTQSKIEYPKKYQTAKFNSIDTLTIKKILNSPNSIMVKNMLNLKVYRPEQEFSYGISYYWQNHRYFVFQKSLYNKQETVIIDLERINDIRKIGKLSAVIFDTDSSFYYVEQSGVVSFQNDGSGGRQNNPHLSKKHVIENVRGYRISKVESIGNEKLVICHTYDSMIRIEGQHEDRISIYLTKEDRLIQDLNQLLKEQ